MGRRRWRGASTPTPFLLLHPLQPHTHSASIGLSQKTRIYRRKKRALDCVFCVGRAVAKNAHLPSQKTRSGPCFLRRSVLPSQKTLINVQIYAPSGITWVTVAKNAPLESLGTGEGSKGSAAGGSTRGTGNPWENASKLFSKVHPWKTNVTCPLKRDYFNRKYIFQTIIFRFYVNLRGCTTNSF